jgi:hypothetical protein
MNTVIKLLLVAALALALAPHSLANEWVPPDIIRMLETGYSPEPMVRTPDSSGPTNISKNMRADNPTTMTNGKRRATPSVQRSTLNEWVPIDMLGPWVFPPDP